MRIRLEEAVGTGPLPERLKPHSIREYTSFLGRRLQNYFTKKQLLGEHSEFCFLIPTPEDLVFELCWNLRHVSNDDGILDGLTNFLSFFNHKSTTEFSHLSRLLACAVFYLVRFVKSKGTVVKMLHKLNKVGVCYFSHITQETFVKFPGDLRMLDISSLIAQALIDSYTSDRLLDVKSKEFSWLTGKFGHILFLIFLELNCSNSRCRFFKLIRLFECR